MGSILIKEKKRGAVREKEEAGKYLCIACNNNYMHI
jgi:hypothetical protein